MKTIQVQAPGLFTTVQDLGREGFGPLGVSPSGAADPISLRLGNRLVENPENAAALEMTLLGGVFLFPEGAVLALSGSDFGATLDNVPVDPWMSFEARPGQTLRLGPTRSGARSYLCVQGGIAVKAFLGSASTHVLSGLGGFEGRPLRKGDVLSIASVSQPYRRRTVAPHILVAACRLAKFCAAPPARKASGSPNPRKTCSTTALSSSPRNPIAWACDWKDLPFLCPPAAT